MRSVLAATMALALVATFPAPALAQVKPGTEFKSAPKGHPSKRSPREAARTKARQTGSSPAPRAARAPKVSPFGWRPADPSFDPQGRPYRPPPGLSCPIDLGYGRWASCNDEF